MNRTVITLSACVLTLAYFAPAQANDNPLCAAKEADIQQQMDTARQQGNSHRVDDLQEALDGLRSNCTDDKLLSDAEDNLQESMEEVKERREELNEAVQDGDMDKVEKRRKKLDEATDELEAHTRELNALRKDRH
ncbi:DUF1090 domain-containing protein [Marinobacter mangrovi]|uniref:DUF1090 domain-containing protein n=1 Tax=Marinobacter mangrovi TaxID=2803918 RepID=UPI001933A97C|nr:DUF1090 domain-containing protein [Marinobacter mangrovi]